MWRFVVVTIACCFLSVCESAVAETAAGSQDPRLGNTVRYYHTSWTTMLQISDPATYLPTLNLDANTNVAIVVHGRQSGVHTEFGQTLQFSLAPATNILIMVDWSFMSHSTYSQAAALVPYVADDLRRFILEMITAGLQLNRLHLIGFDLGAHIVGMAFRQYVVKPAKITALDPAGEGWSASSQRIRASDALYVEVLHTDITGARAYGLADAVGTLDIYPNGGTRQPGCAASDNACHHDRAWRLFDATVNTGGHLRALRCDSMTQVNNDRCVGTPAVVVGTMTLAKLQRGLYRVNTGSIYPF